MDAFCSECFSAQDIEISPRYTKIECEFCGHAVPMFEKREIGAIRSALAAERRKMYIALLLLGGAIFFFVLYVWFNMGDPQVEIPTPDGEAISGVLVGRDDASVTILTSTGEEPKYTFAALFKDEIAELQGEKPYLPEDLAAAQVGAVRIQPFMPEAKAMVLLILTVLASLAAVAFSFIAGQDKVVAEF
jgi:hypothetical protein